MANSSIQVANLAVVNVATANDRIMVLLGNGAVRTANDQQFFSNTQVPHVVGKLRLANTSTPANSTANCVTGDVWVDGNFIYVAVANNSIKRAAISSF